MSDNLYVVQLEYLGGSSRYNKKYLSLKRGEYPGTIAVGHELFVIKTFQWLEYESYSFILMAVGFAVGFFIGISLHEIFGIAGGTVGALLLGQKHDRSKLILTLTDGETDFNLYFRCTRKEFKELSQFL